MRETRTPSSEAVDRESRLEGEDVKPGEEEGEATRGTDVSTCRHKEVRKWKMEGKELAAREVIHTYKHT